MAEEFIKPDIIDEEIVLDPGKVIMSKTDRFGTLEFANDYFMEISGYEEYELMGKSMFCVQHPDMPEVIFKLMWEKLLNKEDFRVIVKNLAKNGKYYWTITNFSYKIDEKTDEIIAIYSKRAATNKKSIHFFSNLYKMLLSIENKSGILSAEKYLIGFMEEKNMSFDELISSSYLEPKIEAEPLQLTKNKVDDKSTLTPKKTNSSIKKPVKKKLLNDEKNSFFQKWFGKTEEELEEERRRNSEK